jgi:twinkle protein
VTEAIHQPCPSCGSSDALQVNSNGSSFCHSCKVYNSNYEHTAPAVTIPTSYESSSDFNDIATKLGSGDYKAITDRGITSATAKTYSVLQADGKVYFGYYEPTEPNVPVACKTRLPNKQFPIYGDWKKGGLFGQQLFSKGSGKYLTIVEGEFDALAAYQMQGSQYPVVSIRNGAGSALKDCKEQYEWIDSFENVVICFDSDKPGIEAANEVAELFGGKAKVMKHITDCKDACDYLRQGKAKEFTKAFWQAERYVPAGIINGRDLWDEVNKEAVPSLFEYPWANLNSITYGVRLGELVTIGAGSGVGKTQFIKEIIYAALTSTEDNIGILALEEGTPVTAKGMMSLAANKRLHVPDVVSTEEERQRAFDKTMGTGRFFLYNHFGSVSVESVLGRIKYMVKALACKVIVLDHISIVVSSQEEKDERKAIDELMTKLRMMVEETNVAMICVSHLNRPGSGKPHEEGGQTSATQFRGSGSIVQLSDIVIGLERNSQADDNYERNLTTPRVIKNRFVGLTGACDPVYYDTDNGRMKEADQTERVL